MNKKYTISLLLIGFLLVGSIFLGTSYSLWQHTNIQEGTNEVKVGCFRITYTNLESYGGQEAGDINLVNAYPVSDEAGASLTPYMFSIKNECSIASDYTVNLETLNTSTFNTDYLRVKFNNVNNVTNNNSVLYAGLDDGTTILTEEASLSKLLTTGHLEYNQTDTYSLRVWVDKNATTTTSNVMGKTWNGKVAVLAEAAAPKDQAYTVVSGDLDTVGSVVKIGTEEFYVIGQEDATHVKLLSKYNLNVGNNIQVGEQGIQNSLATGYTDGESNEVDGYSPGTVEFASTNYWNDRPNGKIKDEYGGYAIQGSSYVDGSGNKVYPYVYDSNASIKQYVDAYVTYLTNQGVNATARLISYDELITLGCNETTSHCDSSNGGTAPEWVYQTSYWTGSAVDEGFIHLVQFGGDLTDREAEEDEEFGVRPVIILEK